MQLAVVAFDMSVGFARCVRGVHETEQFEYSRSQDRNWRRRTGERGEQDERVRVRSVEHRKCYACISR